jgi:flagellar hook-associated protein 3 FlgL
MKISTTYLYDRAVAQMSTSQSNLAQSQAQLSSGKNVLRPSDAPEEAVSIQRLKSVIARQESFEQAIQTTENRLRTEETALDGVSNILTRLKELAIQASNDTYGPKDREIIAIEMQGLQEDLLSFANTRDANGAYLFSGSRVFTPPFERQPDGEEHPERELQTGGRLQGRDVASTSCCTVVGARSSSRTLRGHTQERCRPEGGERPG